MADKFEFGQNISDAVIKIITHEAQGNDKFSAELRSNTNNPESFNRWLTTFSEQTKTNWIVRSSVSSERSRFAFSKDFVCHHSSANKISKKDPAVIKNKNCPATLKVRIKRDTRKIRGTDPYVKEGLLCSIRIRFEHSHNLDVAEAWGWLKRKDDTRKAFIEYFNKGLPPSEAIHFHENLLLAGNPESLADASINPPKKWVYYLHDIWRRNEFGSAKKDANFFQIAEMRLKELEEEEPMIEACPQAAFQPFSAAAPSTSGTSQSNDQEILSLDQDLHSNDQNLVDDFLNNLEKLSKTVKTNKNNPELIKAIKSANPKLGKINGPEAAASFLFSLSSGSTRVQFGKKINVQPTAIARRKAGSRKGSKRVAAGRPMNEISAPKKRKRNLALACTQ